MKVIFLPLFLCISPLLRLVIFFLVAFIFFLSLASTFSPACDTGDWWWRLWGDVIVAPPPPPSASPSAVPLSLVYSFCFSFTWLLFVLVYCCWHFYLSVLTSCSFCCCYCASVLLLCLMVIRSFPPSLPRSISCSSFFCSSITATSSMFSTTPLLHYLHSCCCHHHHHHHPHVASVRTSACWRCLAMLCDPTFYLTHNVSTAAHTHTHAHASPECKRCSTECLINLGLYIVALGKPVFFIISFWEPRGP